MLALAAIACDDGGSPEPTATPTPQPTALEIWTRSMAALEQVESVRVRRTSNLPGAQWDATFPRSGQPSEASVTPWQPQEPLPGFPYYDGVNRTARPPLTNMRLLAEGQPSGSPVWAISFEGYVGNFEPPEGYYEAKAWIRKDSYLIDRIEYEGIRPRIGASIALEYSDYQLERAQTPQPEATPTASGLPPYFVLVPAKGPCNGEVRLRGYGLKYYEHRVSAQVWLSYVSERGEVEAPPLPADFVTGQVYADERGEVSIKFQPAEDWCASPEVAMWRTVEVTVRVHGGDIEVPDQVFAYYIEPCASMVEVASAVAAYCFSD